MKLAGGGPCSKNPSMWIDSTCRSTPSEFGVKVETAVDGVLTMARNPKIQHLSEVGVTLYFSCN